MWLTLAQGARSMLSVSNRQSIWPAPDATDAELVITTRAKISEDVLIATSRLVRLRYNVHDVEILMGLNDQEPRLWPDSTAITGKSFEIMITERGAIIVPSQGPRLPNCHASWLNILAEDVRSSSCIPPGDLKIGNSWKLTPAFPGGLPPNTSTADFNVQYELAGLTKDRAEVNVAFAIRLMLDASARAGSGQGRGQMKIQLERAHGVRRATRAAHIEMTATDTRNQLLRSDMELVRL